MAEGALEPVYLVQRLRDALARDEGELGLVVEVVHDHVFLRGVVPNEQRRRSAEETARRICPGYGIRNEIALCPPTAAEEPEDLR
jgi:hypothetical protein